MPDCPRAVLACTLLCITGSLSAPLPRGMLDVTQPPFSVDSTGTKDVTVSLRAAIAAALAENQVLWLPPGRFLVSDTLNIVQPCEVYKQRGDGGVNIVDCRFRPNVLVGSTAALPLRPTIVLTPNAAGFGNASSPKNVIKLTNSVAENVNMNQAFRGINIEISPGNPGAIGLSACGAQGLAIQDVSVDMSHGGFAAFAGGNGAGGSHVNIVRPRAGNMAYTSTRAKAQASCLVQHSTSRQLRRSCSVVRAHRGPRQSGWERSLVSTSAGSAATTGPQSMLGQGTLSQ
jgi:hypothetical protein